MFFPQRKDVLARETWGEERVFPFLSPFFSHFFLHVPGYPLSREVRLAFHSTCSRLPPFEGGKTCFLFYMFPVTPLRAGENQDLVFFFRVRGYPRRSKLEDNFAPLESHTYSRRDLPISPTGCPRLSKTLAAVEVRRKGFTSSKKKAKCHYDTT